MIVKFVPVLLVLTLIYFTKLNASWCHFRWTDRYQRFLKTHIQKTPLRDGYAELLVIVMSMAIILSLILLVMGHNSENKNLLDVLFYFVVLFYSLCSLNLNSNIKTYVEKSKTNSQEAYDFVLENFYVNDDVVQATPRQTSIAIVLQATNQALFSMLFWFMLLGPVGVAVYRLCYYFANEQRDELQIRASATQNILDWIPARLFGLTIALLTHFSKVMPVWFKFAKTDPSQNALLLSSCGFAALDVDESHNLGPEGSIETELLAIITRSLIFWVGVMAVLTLFELAMASH